MKNSAIIVLLFAFIANASAGNKIKYFFNKPVDTSIATDTKAAYLNTCIADTLVNYLNKARYSMDICVYDFDKTLSFSSSTLDTVFAPRVADAINNAYNRGVKVRFIYEGSNGNTGLTLLNSHIPRLPSPQGSNYTIMHNKFVVIDARSPNSADPYVWTGCLNWYYEQFNWDYNNVVVLQDSALAKAYTAEFNMMWGGTDSVPNTGASKFGQYKTDLGLHHFTIDGVQVELYFSPSDHTDSHIQSTITSAKKDLYFGMYTFTEHTDADLILAKYQAGLNVYGINDSWSNSDYSTGIFNTGLGSHFKVYTGNSDSLYHNKFLIVDPSDTCSDPMVLTGSHNWSVSADTKNDENTLIIHSASAANQYLQYLKATFNELGGTMTIPAFICSTTGINIPSQLTNGPAFVYPNPSNGDVSINYELGYAQAVSISITNILGQQVDVPASNDLQAAGRHHINYTFPTAGWYLVSIKTAEGTTTLKAVVTR